MSNYEKQNFVSGQILKAEHLNNIEDGFDAEIDRLSEDIGELIVQQFDYAVTSKTVIRPNGSIEDVSASYAPQQYKVTDYIDVSGKNRIVVSASAWYGNLLYAFYDDNKAFVSGKAGNGAADTIVNAEIIVPVNAKYVIVGTEDRTSRLFVGYYVTARETLVSQKTVNGKWLLLGDSLTDNRNDTTPMRYYDYVAHPSCTFVNDAVSGSGYIQNNGSEINNIISKVEALTGEEDYTIISVFAGINDSGNNFGGAGLGEFGNTDPSNMYGAIYAVFNGLQEKFPNAFIFAITPTLTNYRHSANNEIDQLAEAVRNVCAWLKIPVADVNKDCPLKPWISANQAENYAENDGVHPKQAGHKLIAKVVRRVFDFM